MMQRNVAVRMEVLNRVKIRYIFNTHNTIIIIQLIQLVQIIQKK